MNQKKKKKIRNRENLMEISKKYIYIYINIRTVII